MFNVCSLTHVLHTLSKNLHTLSKIHKKGVLPECALNVRFEKNYFNAWVFMPPA